MSEYCEVLAKKTASVDGQEIFNSLLTASGLTMAEACEILGVSRKTLYDWRKKDLKVLGLALSAIPRLEKVIRMKEHALLSMERAS